VKRYSTNISNRY